MIVNTGVIVDDSITVNFFLPRELLRLRSRRIGRKRAKANQSKKRKGEKETQSGVDT
ncbi:MAG: hypothetical protein ACMUEL_09605 [Flavobacteriales bacterium Tduv]